MDTMMGKILTRDNLHRRDIVIMDGCSMCKVDGVYCNVITRSSNCN
jgi:hypothetical protein